MAPGTKRIALGGLALAVLAWIAIGAYLPDDPPPAPEPRAAAGLAPIPEREPRAPRAAPAAAPAPSATTPAAAPVEALLAVLGGCFSGMREDGATLSERYAAGADGAIEGEFREVNHDGSPAAFETLRIARGADGWRYHPAPDGIPAQVSFQLVAAAPGYLRFANPQYDFPKLIEYRRVADTLTTHVEGLDGEATRTDDYSTQRVACATP